MVEKIETLTLTAEQAFKSRKNFEDFIKNSDRQEIIKILSDCPRLEDKTLTIIAELTQNFETYTSTLIGLPKNHPPHNVVWIVANERENLVECIKIMNSLFSNGNNIFLLKAYLNNNEMAFKPLVLPSNKIKRNSNTNTKQLQLSYWQKYFEICDSLESDLQVKPASQHWQYIPIGKAGVSIQLTINTQQNYVGCELLINNDKEIFYSLEKSKEKIEKQLGELDWQELNDKKSSRIRKVYPIDIIQEENWKTAVKEQIRMAEEFKSTFTKYL